MQTEALQKAASSVFHKNRNMASFDSTETNENIAS